VSCVENDAIDCMGRRFSPSKNIGVTPFMWWNKYVFYFVAKIGQGGE